MTATVAAPRPATAPGVATVTGTATGLRIEGRVDFVNAEEVCDAGRALLRARTGDSAPAGLEVDLSRLDHAGSVVVAVLLAWARTCSGPMRLVALPDSLRRVLEVTGLDDLFDVAGAATVAGSQDSPARDELGVTNE